MRKESGGVQGGQRKAKQGVKGRKKGENGGGSGSKSCYKEVKKSRTKLDEESTIFLYEHTETVALNSYMNATCLAAYLAGC